jgi:hypothetical protein
VPDRADFLRGATSRRRRSPSIPRRKSVHARVQIEGSSREGPASASSWSSGFLWRRTSAPRSSSGRDSACLADERWRRPSIGG